MNTSSKTRLLRSALVAALVASQTGCILLFPPRPAVDDGIDPGFGDDFDDELGAISFDFEWEDQDRPVRADDAIRLDVFSETDGFTVTISFAEEIIRTFTGTRGVVEVTGAELGEGMGTLVMEARNLDGVLASQRVQNFLVDLTPPVVEVETAILNGSGTGDLGLFRAWVGDAWVLSSAELWVGNELLAHEDFEGWPASLGQSWDWSLFTVPSDLLPTGPLDAALIVHDRAGNRTAHLFSLLVDDTPPEGSLSIAHTVDHAVVTLTGSDDQAGELDLSLVVGGIEMATAVGNSTTFLVDREGFALGTLVQALVTDAAGNSSLTAGVPLHEPQSDDDAENGSDGGVNDVDDGSDGGSADPDGGLD